MASHKNNNTPIDKKRDVLISEFEKTTKCEHHICLDKVQNG